jgi:DNA polymerase iota
LITEAKKICPDVIIVLGEELGRFRDASKSLYKFLESFTWSGKVERLGFDEVWMDVTDLVDWNQALLNSHDLTNSFFQ